MKQELEIRQYDALIVGAGPAGCAAALRLREQGFKVALIEKSSFPRDKVCGDAIPGRAIKVLKSLDPSFGDAFKDMPHKVYIKRSEFHVFEKEPIEVNWVNEAYTCSRMTFDHEVFKLAEAHAGADIYQNTKLESVEQTATGIIAKAGKKQFEAKLVIGCDGAQSVVARLLTKRSVDHRHHSAAVRAYYEGVEGLAPHTTECYVLDKYSPGYFWIFPVEGGRVNAGFGMRSDFIADKKLNLRKIFHEFIEEYPLLKEKMKNAKPLTKVEGFSLPMGSRWVKMSGERFFLAGDAASLIDPISGDGIGNAMLSGYLAGEQAIECLQKNDFSLKMGEVYEQKLYEALGKELARKGMIQQIASNNMWLIHASMYMVKLKWFKKLMKQVL